MSKKLDLFEDKDYKDMDWLGKAIEPFIFPLNEKLGSFPDRYDFPFRTVSNIVKNGGYVSQQQLLQHAAADLGIDISPNELEIISKLIKFNVVDFTIDLATGTMTGEFSLLREKAALEDEDIKEHMAERLSQKLYNLAADSTPRLNELMDIIGATEARTSKSPYQKKNSVQSYMRKVIAEDMWRLRSAPLIERLGDWMIDYVNNGNLASLSNVTRLKCMTYAKDPIYSLKETV